MRSQFLKLPFLILSIVLALNQVAYAGYSTDSACTAVSNAAKDKAKADKDRVDNINKTVNQAIKKDKECVDNVLAAIDKTIGNGTGYSWLDAILQQLKKSVATEACSNLENAKNSISNQAAPLINTVSAYPNQNTNNTGNGGAWVDIPAITQRIANIF